MKKGEQNKKPRKKQLTKAEKRKKIRKWMKEDFLPKYGNVLRKLAHE